MKKLLLLAAAGAAVFMFLRGDFGADRSRNVLGGIQQPVKPSPLFGGAPTMIGKALHK